jgi:hypothetical protein
MKGEIMKHAVSVLVVLVIIFAVTHPLVFTVAGAYAQTTQIERIDVVDYGIYTADVISSQRDAQGILQSSSTNVQHVQTTRDVPAQIGVRFGFRFRVVGAPSGAEVRLKKITIFPPGGLRNPASAQAISRSETTLTTTVGNEVTYTAYKFDDPWELTTGPWTIELWHGDRKLASQNFTVFKP